MIEIQQRADILLLLVNSFDPDSPLKDPAKGILTGKIFEYLACRKPILAIGAVGGEVDDLLKETGSGHLFDFADAKGIAEFIQAVKRGEFKVANRAIESYSRRSLAGKMGELLDGIKSELS